MKYLGEKSLSSVLSIVFKVAWYLILAISTIAGVLGVILIIVTSFYSTNAMGIDLQTENWMQFQKLSAFAKIFILIYLGILITLTLKIIKRSQRLFTNFKNNIVFDQTNVTHTFQIGTLMVWFAILTFDFSTLLVSLLLLMLCEIFKSGAMLQEEHDLTI